MAGLAAAAILARRLWCCTALLALVAACLAVDGRAIIGGGGRRGCSSSETMTTTEQFENGRAKAEDLRPLDSAAEASLEGGLAGWEMRRVPSGPDPLHHNGSPKKPHTP